MKDRVDFDNIQKRNEALHLIAPYIAEGIKKSVEREMGKGRVWSNQILNSYSDEKFIQDCLLNEPDTKSLIVFLQDIIMNLGSIPTYKSISLILAELFSTYYMKGQQTFEWAKGVGCALIIRSYSRSKEIADIVSKLVPTYPSYQKMYYYINKVSSAIKNQIELFTTRNESSTDRVITFDNVGDYTEGTSRGGQAANARCTNSIITMLECNHLPLYTNQTDLKGGAILQKMSKHSPLNFKSKKWLIENHPNFYCLQTAPMNNMLHIQESENDLFKSVSYNCGQYYYEEYMKELRKRNYKDKIIERSNEENIGCNSSRENVEEEGKRRQCSFCLHIYKSSYRKCSAVDGCGAELPLTLMGEEEYKVAKTKFPQYSKKRQRDEENSTVSIYCDSEPKMKKQRMNEEEIENNKSKSEFIKELLWPLMLNPNTNAAYKLILEYIGRSVRMNGDWLKGDDSRTTMPASNVQWLYVSFNQGADPTAVMAQLKGDYLRFHPVGIILVNYCIITNCIFFTYYRF